MMKINSKGQKSIPLEELKTFTGADKVETVDLIQENNLDRFEKKKPNKHRNKNTGNNKEECEMSKYAERLIMEQCIEWEED